MPLLEWTPALSCGFQGIDEDHKELLEITNTLFDAVVYGRGKEIVEEVLEELLDYTSWHFGHEERLMKEHGYPDYFHHKTEHALLTERVLAFQARYRNGDEKTPEELLSFLRRWLVQHFDQVDSRLGRFLYERS